MCPMRTVEVRTSNEYTASDVVRRDNQLLAHGIVEPEFAAPVVRCTA
jgi:hypothetical protein